MALHTTAWKTLASAMVLKRTDGIEGKLAGHTLLRVGETERLSLLSDLVLLMR